LRFFAPQGRHVAPMGVKFGMEPNFTPSVQRQGCMTPKIEIFAQIYQNVEYKRPAGAYPLRDFHKICRVCTSFQHVLRVEILLDLLVLVLVDVGRRVQCELLLPHSRSRRFLNVFTVLALTTLSGSSFQWCTTL